VGAALGVILGAVYMLAVVQKMFLGPITKRENELLPDLNRRELLAVAPLVIMIFVIGLFPNLLLSRMRDACLRVAGDLETRILDHPAPNYYTGPIRLLPRKAEATRVAGAPPPLNVQASN
jgi:NADH-quinone oxidoreductase subunit M